MSLTTRVRAALSDRGTVTFCDACSQVCDGPCRAAAIRDRAINTGLLPPRH